MSTTLPAHKQELWGHPKGLFILFFTELWERFSYYGMRAILVLYIISSATGANPGLGWSNSDALALYGWYTMAVYVVSIPGGIIADKLLGQKKTVLLGGLLLVLGHGILAVEQMWAFYAGLVLIVLGVGGLKPNISTMVGGLYPVGDERRDKGFTIFYIGINLGAFISSLLVGYIGETYGWHYGFGLAGIGMLIGQIVYMYGQKYLVGVGDFIGKGSSENAALAKKPLTPIEKDRIKVMLLSFLIVIVFWGAFEQAGGLMNIYTFEKIDRNVFNWEIPASVFQSVNAFFIITLGTAIAAFWAARKFKGKESSSLFKMALGVIIMGTGFLFMTTAAVEASSETFGKAGLIWLILAYLFHTVGELCASPVALSYITKLAPLKYASIMMGVYFAATGFGNKLAGSIGESSQLHPFVAEVAVPIQELSTIVPKDTIMLVNSKNEDIKVFDYPFNHDKSFEIKSKIYIENEKISFIEYSGGDNFTDFISLESDKSRLIESLNEYESSATTPLHAKLLFEKVKESDVKGDYEVSFVLEEEQSAQELKIFTGIAIFCVLFGLIIIAMLKPLKRLAHGAEDLVQAKA